MLHQDRTKAFILYLCTVEVLVDVIVFTLNQIYSLERTVKIITRGTVGTGAKDFALLRGRPRTLTTCCAWPNCTSKRIAKETNNTCCDAAMTQTGDQLKIHWLCCPTPARAGQNAEVPPRSSARHAATFCGTCVSQLLPY